MAIDAAAHHYDIRDFKYAYAQGEELHIDSLHIDTALTIQHYYTMNFRLRDNFALMPFSNIGQPLNPLTYTRHDHCIPEMGFYAKAMQYKSVGDVPYYDVKRPFTELRFNTGFQHGHALNTLFSYNPHSRLNLTLDYNGLRSPGDYPDQLSSIQRFLFSIHYQTPSGRYQVYGHYLAQGLHNKENGGISFPKQFESGNPRYRNRANIATELSGAVSEYKGQRFYVHQAFKLLKPAADTLYDRAPLALYHTFHYESKEYLYYEKQDNPKYDRLLGLVDKKRRSETHYERLGNELGLRAAFLRGALRARVGMAYTRLRYRLDTVYSTGIYQTSGEIAAQLFTLKTQLKAALTPEWSLALNFASHVAVHRFGGAYMAAAAVAYSPTAWGRLRAGLTHSRTYPDMMWQLYRSFYSRLIWEAHFSPLEASRGWLKLRAEKLLDLMADFTAVKHYIYRDADYRLRQLSGSFALVRLQIHKDLRLWRPVIQGNVWKLQCDNTFLYQKLLRAGKILPLPEYVTRNTLYFQGNMFQRALNAQFGISFYQFAAFPSRRYIPFVSGFALQENPSLIGGYPLLDFFVNGKVDRFRWTLKLEHFNADFTGYKYYSAPAYPYRDWKIRVAITWFLVN